MRKTIAILTILGGITATAAFAASPTPTTSMQAPASLQHKTPDPTDPTVPGATGRTIVIGDPSTIAGDEAATHIQQMGDYSGGGG